MSGCAGLDLPSRAGCMAGRCRTSYPSRRSSPHRMSQFEVNAPHIVGEVIDGEAIWRGIEAAMDTAGLPGLLRGRFPDSGGDVARDVAAFLAQLQEYQLIRPAGPDAAGSGTTGDLFDGIDAYASPELQAYTDMKDLLLLDPVHEVDDAGWPEAKS